MKHRRSRSIEDNPDVAVLECLLCRRGVTSEEVRLGLFQLSSNVCNQCYRKMQDSPYEKSCFGKVTIVHPKRQLGYNPNAIECKELCPDRVVCRKVIMEQ